MQNDLSDVIKWNEVKLLERCESVRLNFYGIERIYSIQLLPQVFFSLKSSSDILWFNYGLWSTDTDNFMKIIFSLYLRYITILSPHVFLYIRFIQIIYIFFRDIPEI